MTIKVFKLDDYEWWAGESLAACIAAARAAAGAECYPEAELDGYELDEAQMARIRFIDDDGQERSFAERLQLDIEDGGEFPRLFAATDH